jgi:5-methylcytosine-specific restriction endonuclease McrA
VDHIFAVSEGGQHFEENLVLSCPCCNGILSRSGNLRTFEERKAVVLAKMSERLQDLVDMREMCGRQQ